MTDGGGAVRKGSRTVGWMLLLGILFAVVWYVIASDYSYGAISGTYKQDRTIEQSALVLRKDQSFQQEVIHNGITKHAKGSWRRLGEGRVVFSQEFITLPSLKRRSDGEVDGEIKKRFGLFPYIVFDPQPGGPIFHRRISR